jgi:uncharacterized delta-60 repeat protein
MRKMKISLLLILALATIASCALWGRSASANNQSPIIYHNGPVMAGTSNVYLIWYGNWSASSGPNSLDTQIILINFQSEIGSSINFQINATYPGVNGSPSGGIIYGGSEFSSYTHGTELDAAAIQGIVSETISSGRLLYDPKGIYLVIASSDVGSNATGFCTPNTPPHHGSFFHAGGQVKYAFIGNAARCPSVAAPQFFAADGSQLATPNGNLAADAMASMIAHALDTTVTDPFRTAWFDDFGLENADKCQGSFSKTHTIGNGARVNFTSNGHNYLIQDNWVNNFGGYCGQQNDAPPRCDDQTVQVIQDTAKQITLTAVDDNGDAVSFSIVTPPQHGTLTGNGANRTYTPANNFFGADSFTFKANDGTLDSAVATVSINVNTNSALDGFDPNANGLVRVAVVQPDGKILIGGDFTTLAPNGRLPVTRNYIARLNTDGTVDPTFNPSANSSVQAIALQSDGKIILGGDFNAFAPNGGASIIRGNLARFNADGTIDTTFDPRANGSVHAIAVQADGGIVIGGEFQQFNPGGGATVLRNRIARLNPNGALDTTFDPKANNTVESLAVQPDGRILMGGRFTTLAPNGGATVTRNYVARLNVDGTLDAAFNPNPDSILGGIAVQPDGKILIGGAFITLTPNGGSPIARNHLARLNADGTVDVAFNPNVNGFVRLIILQPDGKVLIGGGFNSLAPNGGSSVVRKYIARLNPDGTLDPGVDANPNDQVWAIALQPDGKIVVGGVFFSANSFRGQTRNRIARLEKDGRLDQSLNLNTVGSSVVATAVQPDGKILIGGIFNTVLGVARKNIARLNTDGTLDTTFNTGTNGYVGAIAVQPDGKILVGGDFTALILNGTALVPSVLIGVTRNHIARMNADGTIDEAFDPNADDVVNAIAVQPDGKILIGGFFTALAPNGGASVARNVMTRLDTNGEVDPTFNPNPNLDVYAIALQADGKILVGGLFTALAPNGGASIPRNFIARLNTDGTVETAFDPNANDQVKAFALQPDGKIVVGGLFTTLAPFGGATVTRNRIARLNVDGTLDNAFDPNANNTVASVALQADGKILVGGSFATLSPNGGASQARNTFARLNADGTVDAFDPQPNNQVFAIALQPDGKVLVGGIFDTIGGQSRSLFARLANDTPAIQDLGVTQTSVTWTRSGAEPQLSRVSFERSTDGVNYTFLGNGTRVGTSNDFTLTGQNLATQQNLYIRARGSYRGGQYNVSGSITESVRNVFLPPAFHLGFAQQPTNTLENGAITPAVTVQILDAANNLVNSTVAVTIDIGTNPSSGTLIGTRTVSAVAGTATFNNLSIDKSGSGYTLAATGTNLTGAVSNPFNITVEAPSSIAATAGSGQSATINSTFGTPLQATVTTDSGKPVSGVVVTFTAPASGPGGTFTNNTTTITATTDANGTATTSLFKANGAAGLYAISASINAGSLATAFSLTNLKANQTIAVAAHAPAAAAFNTQFNVAAASSSGLPVSYGSSGSCTNNGTSFTMTSGAGACTVKYEQAGDVNHNAAPTVTETVSAQKAAQAITFGALADKVFGDSDFLVNASASSGLSTNFAASGKCTANGNTVHITGAGSCTITASQSGDSSYDAAPDVARIFTTSKAGQTISFDGLANKTFGDSDFAISATTNSGLAVSFAVAGQCTVAGSLVHLNGAGSCTVTASQPGDANYTAATEVLRSFEIAKAAQTITFDAIANKTFGDPDFQISASATSGRSVTFTTSGQCANSGTSVHISGAGSCIITASEGGDANYNAATEVQRAFEIAKAAQTISFDGIADRTFGDPDLQVSASATSGRPVSFATAGQCANSGSSVHISGAGSCTVTASEVGDANYNAATEVRRSFQIAKAGQTITFDAIANRTFGDPDFQISASATSGRPVGFATSGQCANSGPTVHISGAGNCTITASEGGDANYNAAPDLTSSFQISKASTTTALSSSANPPAVGQSVTFTAAVTSGVAVPSGSVTFKYDGAAITSCGDVNLQSGSASCVTSALSAGTHTLTAEYSGEANFDPSFGTLITERLAGSVFEFSQASYGVAERGGFVTIAVQRTGDLTATASVDYATDDGSAPSVAVPCSLVTGFALERCDYTRAAGTLQFAANETEKSFVVLVNDDSYVEGTETTSITLSNPGGSAALGPRATSTLQIMDDLAESFGNQSDDGATFVRQHYHDFLNREPDSEGLQFWTNNLECDTDGCTERKRVDTSASFFLSLEFQETGYLVERFYKAAYGDATGASTFGGPHQLSVPIIRWREFLHDTQEIGNGVIVGRAAWQQQLEDQKQAFAREFISRARFTVRYPASLSAEQFVNQLNANTGGVLTNAETMQLEETFGGPGATSADGAKRAQVLRTIAESQVLRQKEFNRAFVLMQYFGYLRRNPDDAQDTDYTGYDFWLQKLERFGGNYLNAEMVRAFVSSIEYRQRFGQ